jgi:hypothetical protein
MPGITKLQKLQLGKEATAGTKVTPTTILRIPDFTIDDNRVVVIPNENIGYINPTDRSYIPAKGATISLAAAELSFEQPYFAEASIKAVSTGAADGGGSGKVYTYSMETAGTANTTNTYSMEIGNDNATKFAQYCYCKDFEISGRKGEAVKVSSNWGGRDCDLNALSATTITLTTAGSVISHSGSGLGIFSAGSSIILNTTSSGSPNNGTYVITSISSGSGVLGSPVTTMASGSATSLRQTFSRGVALPTVEEVLFQKGKLYIDAVTGSIGTTQITNTFIGFSFKYNSGISEKMTGDGNLYYSFTTHDGASATLDVTFEDDIAPVNEWLNYTAGTARQVRLVFQGSAFATAGSTYTYKTFIIDAIGKWIKFTPPSDDNGNQVVTGTLQLGVDPTTSTIGQLIFVNALTALA